VRSRRLDERIQPASVEHGRATTNNWIGRSQLAVDPYFKGAFDDFRIYDRALTAAKIVAIVTN
jgi:hypothetical protein